MTTQRIPAHDIHPSFINRWSPRSFTGESISPAQLERLFEAARWAPSAFNAQPWRFLHARRESAYWDDFLGLLLPFNQRWAANASALIFVLSKRDFQAPGKDSASPLPSHAFDAGAAWANLALQAEHDGWYSHAMGGFERERAYSLLGIPADHDIHAAIAIGRLGPVEQLPEDLQVREHPSQREPLHKLVAEGRFHFDPN